MFRIKKYISPLLVQLSSIDPILKFLALETKKRVHSSSSLLFHLPHPFLLPPHTATLSPSPPRLLNMCQHITCLIPINMKSHFTSNNN